ncbi:bifunctional folylpolyglutamate synthase/dihydrofolate synthase [Aquibacillus saliphilus]|uniref:bifunctional folylpolyglutamate synthase/dihydrofolate synthase n=1 Tax=Aquibacillus saliphilus TaxID=1909422 RepID=UPI001CF00706|nr:folylpolyglutamate synthase/dihydrofolate synthase family protein [Aquibacillus saliphilus]
MYFQIDEVIDFLQTRTGFGIKPGLERMDYMLKHLDHPEQQLKVVHIAGTNGKGSTLTFIKEALVQNGYKVGSFTSPSIDRFNHQIQINDQPISDQSLIEIVNKLMPIINQLDQTGDAPTEFEITVVIAILYFVSTVDIALIETGMGGREDSTNSVLPILTIITNIGMDHVAFLGDTYEEIANHKAGIIKQGVPIILGDINREALSIIAQVASDKRAQIYQLNTDYQILNQELNRENQEIFSFKTDECKIDNILIAMKGEHQITNAAIACMALNQLTVLGYNLDIDSSKKGLQQAFIAGRFEKVYANPTVIVDGAHNVEGFKAFIKAANRIYPEKKKHLIFAAFEDKPLKKMAALIGDNFEKITFTSFDHSRAAKAEQLQELSIDKASINNNWKQIISSYIEEKDNENILFITGSLYFIRLIRKYFEYLK